MIWGIIFLAITFRLIVINQSLWLDEAIGAIAVRDYSFIGIVTEFLKLDNHPPLYYLTLKAWVSPFGFSEISLRLLSVVFGVLTILVVYLIGKKLARPKDRFFPFFSALLLASSPFHIYYSQEARMYSMAAFLASLAIYSFLFIIESKQRSKWPWWLFSFSITALVFTDYVPIFLLPVFWLYAIIKRQNKAWWLKFLVFHSPIFALGVLWLPILKIQLASGSWLLKTLPAWKQIAGGTTFKQAALVWMKFVLGRISLRNKMLYYLLVVFASVPVVLAGFRALWLKKRHELIWLWLFVPLILGFFSSFWMPIFIYFRFLYVIPAFYLIVSWGTTSLKNRSRILLSVSLLFVNIAGWLIYVKEPYQQREHWREAVSFVEERVGKEEVVIFEYPEPFAPYRWYEQGRVEAVGVTDSILANAERTTRKTRDVIQGKKGVYYFEYLRDLSDPQRVVEATLVEEGFEADMVFDFFPGVGQITYWAR